MTSTAASDACHLIERRVELVDRGEADGVTHRRPVDRDDRHAGVVELDTDAFGGLLLGHRSRITLSVERSPYPQSRPPLLPGERVFAAYSGMDEEVYSEAGLPLAVSYDHPSSGRRGAGGARRVPFTRGNFPRGYRGRSGRSGSIRGSAPPRSPTSATGPAGQGGTGLSVALDLPTQCGYDSDHPDVEEEVGRVGVALDTLADAEILFDQIPLDSVSTSFTINGTAAILLAFYVAAGEKQGVPRAKLRGTIQNDILKEYVSRGTWIWPPRPSLRLIADTIEFCAKEVPRFNPIRWPARTFATPAPTPRRKWRSRSWTGSPTATR